MIIGICNGFQALVKSGLLPYGNFEDASSTSPTLFYNDANQHVAKMVETRIANTNSPWLAGVEVGDIHAIPVFPGTNSEYDSAKAFEKEGAKVNLVPFVTLNEEAIVKSVDTMVDNIEKANIIFFAGGFSAADEPDGSAKFIVNILLNEKVRAAIDHFIERGGLIIGICNGFQALVKSGLLPYGNFEDASSTSPTLFYNDANQHVAKMVETRIANTNSPWLAGVEVGDIHAIPVSHGEGKFVVTAEEFAELRDNGQIFSQYVDFEGKPSMDSKYNPNGSVNAIEGITSKNGQIIGKMGHSERFEDGLFQNIPGNKDQHLFASAVKYFTGK